MSTGNTRSIALAAGAAAAFIGIAWLTDKSPDLAMLLSWAVIAGVFMWPVTAVLLGVAFSLAIAILAGAMTLAQTAHAFTRFPRGIVYPLVVGIVGAFGVATAWSLAFFHPFLFYILPHVLDALQTGLRTPEIEIGIRAWAVVLATSCVTGLAFAIAEMVLEPRPGSSPEEALAAIRRFLDRHNGLAVVLTPTRRASRKEFAIGLAATAFFVTTGRLFVGIVIMPFDLWLSHGEFTTTYLPVVMVVLGLWACGCLFINRLHDLDRSGVFAFAPALLGLLIVLIDGTMLASRDKFLAGTMAIGTVIYFAVAFVLLIGDGKPEANRFGPSSLRRTSSGLLGV